MMQGMDFLAIAVAAGAAATSVVWYTLFAGPMEKPGNRGSAGTAPLLAMLFVVVQSCVVAFLVAYFVSRLGISGLAGVAGFGALIWIFLAGIFLGSVVHEGVPPTLAGIHAGDRLAKLILSPPRWASGDEQGSPVPATRAAPIWWRAAIAVDFESCTGKNQEVAATFAAPSHRLSSFSVG